MALHYNDFVSTEHLHPPRAGTGLHSTHSKFLYNSKISFVMITKTCGVHGSMQGIIADIFRWYGFSFNEQFVCFEVRLYELGFMFIWRVVV